MELLAIDMPVLTLLQILVTVAVVGTFAFLSAIRESDADHVAECETIILASFLLDHHPKINHISDIGEADPDVLADSGNEIHWTSQRLESFRKTGALPSVGRAASTTVGEHFAVLLLAPLAAAAMLAVLVGEGRKYRAYRVRHTELRRNYMGKAVLLGAGSVGYLSIAVLVLGPLWSPAGIVLTAVSALGLATSLVLASLFVWSQAAWRSYWSEGLLQVIGLAAKGDDHDLFNRAYALRSEVARQPIVPIPWGLGFYAVVFSMIQGMLLWLSEFMGL